MKSVKISNLGDIRNELNKYKKGKKFDIHQFNQMARLAWLGKIVMQPLDAQDEKCQSFLLYCEYPDEFQAHFLDPDQDLVGQMHIVDGEQALAFSRILQRGVEERARLYRDLRHRDFYFDEFYRPKIATDERVGQGTDQDPSSDPQ